VRGSRGTKIEDLPELDVACHSCKPTLQSWNLIPILGLHIILISVSPQSIQLWSSHVYTEKRSSFIHNHIHSTYQIFHLIIVHFVNLAKVILIDLYFDLFHSPSNKNVCINNSKMWYIFIRDGKKLNIYNQMNKTSCITSICIGEAFKYFLYQQ